MNSTVQLLTDYFYANPTDATARAALADLLAEEGSFGLLALVRCDKRPTLAFEGLGSGWCWWASEIPPTLHLPPSERLPPDWYRALHRTDTVACCPYPSLAGAYTNAIEAFDQLPPDRQQELLDGRLGL